MAKWTRELIWVARDGNGAVVRMQETAPDEWMKQLTICDWCNDKVQEVCRPHSFDTASGEKMCRRCWDKDRTQYKRSHGEDIGPFRAIKEGEQS
ncbi:hypothetical protein FE783_12770 [Paenibacillus mesophilus]|uniref:hypothetical protein n=1 Tax=Paenibacillus mesophilus TaxID=2582849 RepID=UPI00110D9C9F|nr:hypothetical protein [Paenibacillus mesophilus]TMV49382.1 hypothetical protein FE783_12770 [Paenibacillus mesophilus]